MTGRLRDPASWPASWWYALAVAWAVVATLLSAGLYWAVNGQFWAVAAFGLPLSLAISVGHLWWYRRKDRSEERAEQQARRVLRLADETTRRGNDHPTINPEETL